MYKNNEENKRTEKFKRNSSLENLLGEINNELWCAEEKLLNNNGSAEYPLIFVVGSHRSGSTLFMQWLASLGTISYPTNLMSRFYKAPIIASKIQLILTDERYNYRNELREFNSTIDFSSENGKTKGVLAPNEFWYFWRRFLAFKDLDYMSTDELFEKVDIDTFKSELAGITDVFQKPFALKAMILNYNIDFLDKVFKKAIFIYTKRDPFANIESALKAREKQLGSVDEWYSFKIPEYEKLKKLNSYEQVSGQIYYINKAVERGLKNVAEYKKMTVNYEEFCVNPKKFHAELREKLKIQGCEIDNEYKGETNFIVTRKSVSDENVVNAYNKFYKMGD
ncbi:MAG: sulfotransferase [gamma proteobacterium symbiont of Bathyaustriella thionipta]|nr:sulfotransferase [gamma proteobacterium symbiont of Bathyaustriella thionipta]MCU7949291.1 sulfotransferase [gamma proteobacterium symbiont of Bathyaustriella thionipta]MCU7953995.1 sulfotransferase [gamma proteobacterium symbiont of Bathyaustriella thionipta]MCU7955894.1 sulfotransferase [gamma proteobacterium symbiont of Bathyaustriella thionipta]MCU7966384.1 sulfotransferase [gamma proteobacterium symbiont of Bathyaustriella thionipta]